MSEHHYLACDLGAESGRLMAGHLCDGRLRLEEIHRFPNQPVGGERESSLGSGGPADGH